MPSIRKNNESAETEDERLLPLNPNRSAIKKRISSELLHVNNYGRL